MIYILAPVGLAFALFVVYLIVSLFLKDPARPFRMFGAPPLKEDEASADCSVQSAEEGNGEQER
jgi:hypothetical protein